MHAFRFTPETFDSSFRNSAMDENQENFRTLGKSANLADKSGNNGKKIMQFEQLVPLASQLYIDASDDWISKRKFPTNGIVCGYKGMVILNSKCNMNFISQFVIEKLNPVVLPLLHPYYLYRSLKSREHCFVTFSIGPKLESIVLLYWTLRGYGLV